MQQPTAATVIVHPSQFPGALRAELLRSLRSREINHKFHYESHKQAHKWLALHEAHSPARQDRDCLATYDAAFTGTAELLPRGPLDLVGLGCGGGKKDVRLLELLQRDRPRLSYAPCDVSLPLVLVARSAAQRVIAESAIRPIVCDLGLATDFHTLLRPVQKGGRLITFFGMIPNFEPRLILPRLASIISSRDMLFFSANLVPFSDEGAMRRILPQYDNELTRDWLLTFLFDLGVTPRDGNLTFTIERSGGRYPLQRFVARFHFRRRCGIEVEGTRFVFERGESIRLFFSYRYTPSTITAWLARYGIAVKQQWITLSAEEGIFLCRRE